MGYFPKLEDIPSPITQHIASCQKIPLDGIDSRGLAASSTQRWLKNRIRDYCGMSKFTLAEKGHWLKSFASSMARTKENMVNISNAMLELLVKEQFELPALSTLERIAFSARARINADTFDQIERSLSAETKQQLLNLLSETTETV